MHSDSSQLHIDFGALAGEARPEDEGRPRGLSAPGIEPGETSTGQPIQDELLLERIVAKDNLLLAVERVRANRGSAGIDKMSVSELPEYFAEHLDDVVEEITQGRYKPTPVRRVEIPKKEKGRTRPLGIPTARDRVIQQAIAQVLTPIFDPTFSESSFGFRPGRSAHDALRACVAYANEGYRWVVDMDLEKFFDTVNHSRLMRRVSKRVKDGRVVSLIHRYLNAGVMRGWVFEETRAGVPQGGPLSPLLANIMLDELDKELERRGHRFVRYADDCMVLCKSERAATRTCESVTRFIERKLRLKVNREKTRIAYIADCKDPVKYLGYGFYSAKGVRLRVHPKTIEAMKARVKELTRRSQSGTWPEIMGRLRSYIRGWVNYYRLADMKGLLGRIDSWLSRRVRMLIWKRWKRVRTKYRELRKRGLDHDGAMTHASARVAYWRAACTPGVHRALSAEYLRRAGMPTFSMHYLAG